MRPHRLLVFINPFGGKKKGRDIFHSLVAPLFELAGISSHVIGERQQTSVRLSLCVVTFSLYVNWPFIVKWLNGQTMPEITSSRKTWQALTGKNCQNCSVTTQVTGWCLLNRKEKLLCFSLTVWSVWVGMACSVKYSTDWWGVRSKRQAYVRMIQLSLYSLVLFISASSLPVRTLWFIWFGAVTDGVRLRPVTAHILLCHCRLHGLRVFCHSRSDWPCDLSFAHHHRWGETFILLITFNQQLATFLPTHLWPFLSAALPQRRLSAFGCVLSPSSLCQCVLLSVSVGLWFLWRRTGWEWKTPLDGTSTIWLLRHVLMGHS